MVDKRIRKDAWIVRIMVLCLLAVPTIWFVSKVVRTADRAADVFVRANSARYGSWEFYPPIARRYTIFAVFTSSPCSILDGDVVETDVKVYDGYGTTGLMYSCFPGWWWKESNPSIYTIDVALPFQFVPVPPRNFP